MKMNPKAQVFRLFFLFDGASLLPFPYDWPPVNPLQKRHQGGNHLSPQVGTRPKEEIIFPHKCGKARR